MAHRADQENEGERRFLWQCLGNSLDGFMCRIFLLGSLVSFIFFGVYTGADAEGEWAREKRFGGGAGTQDSRWQLRVRNGEKKK